MSVLQRARFEERLFNMQERPESFAVFHLPRKLERGVTLQLTFQC